MRECDLIMKGGITSGVVYPEAIHELAQTYRFRNIGGTSAGAIAAAVAAAASYGHAHGVPDAFEQSQRIPQWLGGKSPRTKSSNLLALFSPQPTTRPYFHGALACLGHPRGRWLRLLVAGLRWFWPNALLGAAAGLMLMAPAWISSPSYWLCVPTAALTIGFALSAIALKIKSGLIRSIENNDYGFCRGLDDHDHPKSLTGWLDDLIKRISGLQRPLTFGDLAGHGSEPDINLVMMTTNVTQGRPVCLPHLNDTASTYFFDPKVFSTFFPKDTVDWMVCHSKRYKDSDLYFWPEAEHLPVLVATRMSLSFPLLLSAIPVYAIDFSRETDKQVPERNWFSDGGIASNFPIHFFDAALPRRPTFAINLTPLHPDKESKVWMPQTNGQGRAARWYRFESENQLSLSGFLAAIMDSMQNWKDNEQMRIPGYRDRIVHVALSEDEGGLNLNMPPQHITNLSNRGRAAARLLAERFSAHPPEGTLLTWNNHRWVRYRTLMNALEEIFKQMKRAFEHPFGEHELTYEALIQRPLNEAPKSYPFANLRQRKFAYRTTRQFLDALNQWTAPSMTFGEVRGKGTPKPEPQLRVMPRSIPSQRPTKRQSQSKPSRR